MFSDGLCSRIDRIDLHLYQFFCCCKKLAGVMKMFNEWSLMLKIFFHNQAYDGSSFFNYFSVILSKKITGFLWANACILLRVVAAFSVAASNIPFWNKCPSNFEKRNIQTQKVSITIFDSLSVVYKL